MNYLMVQQLWRRLGEVIHQRYHDWERHFFKLNIFLILVIFGALLALSTPLLSDWWGCLVADHIKSIISPNTQSRCATGS
jgi:hypothetical protein